MIARTLAAVGIPLLWNNWLLPRLHLGLRGRTAANAAFATAYAVGFGTRGVRGEGELPSRASDYGSGAVLRRSRRFRDSARTVPIAAALVGVPTDRRVDRGGTNSTRFENETAARWRMLDAAACRGLCWGAALFIAVGLGYGTALSISPMRHRLAEFATRAPQVDLAEWAGIHIPIGTVYSEELIFRGVLDPLLNETAGKYGTWLSALTFGLWHIIPAREADDNVPATILATTATGLALNLLRRRTGGIVAPALLHLALNVGGAIAPRLARHACGRP